MANDRLISVQALCDYLGVGDESTAIVVSLREAAVERLLRATGVDWTAATRMHLANEAIRTMVWQSFYAVRGSDEGAQFLQAYLSGLLAELRSSEEAGAGGTEGQG